MKTLAIVAALASVIATGAMAQRDFDRDLDRDHDRDHGRRLGIPGAIIRSMDRDHDRDCRVIIKKRPTADGGIVESRRRVCD